MTARDGNRRTARAPPAIRRALEFVAAKDPLAFAAATHALGLALDVLLDGTSATMSDSDAASS